jgi:hypothetical protein
MAWNVTAQQVGDRLGGAAERDDLELARVAPPQLGELAPSSCGTDPPRVLPTEVVIDCGSVFNCSARSRAVFMGESRAHGDCVRLVGHHGERRQLGVVECASSEYVVGQHSLRTTAI